jgi:hypothetical protein
MKWLLHALFGLLALVFLSGCLFAVWWIWTIKKPAIDKTTRAFEEADSCLSIAHTAVGDVRNNLQAARADFASAKSANAPSAVKEKIIQAAALKVAPNMNDTQHTLERITEASIVVNSVLEAIEERPFDSLDKLDVNQVRSMQSQINNVAKASWRLGYLLDEPFDGGAVSPAEKAQRISASLETLIDMSSDFQQRLDALHKHVERIGNSTLYWMRLAPLLGTMTLGWIAISQLVVLVVVVKSFRKRQPA